jgi:hypothetical protein
MAVSDARRLQVFEQARAHWGEGPAETLMELVVPAGQDMATKADIDMAVVTLSSRFDGTDRRIDGLDSRIDRLSDRIDGLDSRIDGVESRMQGLATKEYVLRTLLIALTPLYLGMLATAIGITGLYFAR